jgi:Secretion system C-terminal sorting domain
LSKIKEAKMKISILASSILLLITYQINSQYTNIRISNVGNPNESSICINPYNPNQVVVGSAAYFNNSIDTSISSFHYSTNGGLNWSGGFIFSNLASPSGDPVIIVDALGNFYYLQNSNWWHEPRLDRLLCVKSTNGGANWGQDSYLGHNGNTMQDKPWGCVDLTNSIYRNNIYVTWTQFDTYFNPSQNDSSVIMFSRSTDGGSTWSLSKRISQKSGDCVDSDNTMEGAVPCVGPNGEIYVAWAGPKVRNSQYGIYFDKSTDGGVTWLDNDIYVTDQPGGWNYIINYINRCNGLPVTCCDVSNGSYRGNIYVNWSDQRNGTANTDIWFIKSADGGQSWGQVKKVNNDMTASQQFLTWMSVDQVTGYIYFVFYDQRNTSILSAEVYAARSTDAGETFENVKISESSFNLSTSVFFGDYINISAFNNMVRPVWVRVDNINSTSIWTAIIDTFYTIGIKPSGNETPQHFELHQNYPNPFNPETKIKFEIPKSSDVLIKVYDLTGKEITTLVNQYLQIGKYQVRFSGEGLASGIYFYRIVADNYAETRKMILIK